MKKIFVALFLVFFAAAVAAEYCDIAPSPDCVCRDSSGTVIADFEFGSDWISTYCAGNGLEAQKRTTFELVKPDCVERVEVELHQLVPRDYCSKCDSPVTVSGWSPVSCVGNKTLYQRSVLAYYFNQGSWNVSFEKCEVGRFTEFNLDSNGPCGSPAGPPVLWLANNFLVIIAGAAVGIVALAFFVKLKRK